LKIWNNHAYDIQISDLRSWTNSKSDRDQDQNQNQNQNQD
jgi:hypothetical protein